MSQSLGHHIANDAIRDWVFPAADKAAKENTLNYEQGPYDVAIIGDYNIGGDAWSSRILLEEIGLRVVAQWSGWHHQRNDVDSQGKNELDSLLPLYELHLSSYGRSLWYSLDERVSGKCFIG